METHASGARAAEKRFIGNAFQTNGGGLGCGSIGVNIFGAEDVQGPLVVCPGLIGANAFRAGGCGLDSGPIGVNAFRAKDAPALLGIGPIMSNLCHSPGRSVGSEDKRHRNASDAALASADNDDYFDFKISLHCFLLICYCFLDAHQSAQIISNHK